MSTPKLTTYRFRVFFGDPEDPDPRSELVHGVGRDVQKAEAFFADKGWGKTADRPMTAAALTAYYALNRAGRYPGTWADFEAEYLSVEPVEAVTATPTGAGAAPASP